MIITNINHLPDPPLIINIPTITITIAIIVNLVWSLCFLQVLWSYGRTSRSSSDEFLGSVNFDEIMAQVLVTEPSQCDMKIIEQNTIGANFNNILCLPFPFGNDAMWRAYFPNLLTPITLREALDVSWKPIWKEHFEQFPIGSIKMVHLFDWCFNGKCR